MTPESVAGVDVERQARPVFRLAFVAQLAVPEGADPRIFARLQGGADDAAAFRGVFDTLDHAPRFELHAVHADRGEEIGLDYDAVVLGGSVASVNDVLPWQVGLASWLARWREIGRPLLGICGGHQLMAQAMGGTVSRRATGPFVGSRTARMTVDGADHWLFAGLGPDPRFQFAHFDHVSTMPEGGRVLALGAETVAAADYGGGWVSVQFHPEVSCDRLATLWYGLTDDRTAFEYLHGCERLIDNFLAYAVAATEENARSGA
ncbi:MAG: type 1 glutamine amidotransferase [Sphingopyxis sp.]|nr:type 1 glutamine amidotransferase [Sphingopyxis sp.]